MSHDVEDKIIYLDNAKFQPYFRFWAVFGGLDFRLGHSLYELKAKKSLSTFVLRPKASFSFKNFKSCLEPEIMVLFEFDFHPLI